MEVITAYNKETPTDHAILNVIKNRWSPRSFSDESITQDTLERLFEALRWAPSAMNEQPWRIIVGRKGDSAYQRMFESLMPGNQPWAAKAPVLLTTLIKKTYTRNGAPNGSAKHDLGLAIGNLSAQATHEGLGLHQMGGFNRSQLAELFNLPEDYEPVTVIALGYPGNPDQLTEDLRARELAPRNRKELNEIIYYGDFK
ncbi:nitroreductase family protein [Marinoscillum sp.]|uniref:nitroreductase family protein n=1 Tax=Marinoscillum sp. TaxID=2024838 RepID=UPI003BAB2180